MSAIKNVKVTKSVNKGMDTISDFVAVEEPLQISISIPDNTPPIVRRNISITMRTPGHDKELAVGFLFTENIIQHIDQVSSVRFGENSINLNLKQINTTQLKNLNRNFYTSSSCGICGKASIENIKQNLNLTHSKPSIKINARLLSKVDIILAQHQQYFNKTGGLHAAMILDHHMQFISLFEDVGRHNALDKAIGHHFINKALPISSHILVLSGRISFELVHKAAMAGIQVVIAFGAPSSLAIETAEAFDICLVGFLKPNSFNIYNDPMCIIEH